MIIDYIPKELDTREKYNKFKEMSDHLISVSTILSARIKIEKNISEVMIDENENTEKLAQLIKRLARQDFEFVKNWAIKEGLYAESKKNELD